MKTFPSASERAGFVTGWSRGDSIWTSTGTSAHATKRRGAARRRKTPIAKLPRPEASSSSSISSLIRDAIERSVVGLSPQWSESQRQAFGAELHKQVLRAMARDIWEALGDSDTPILEFPVAQVRTEGSAPASEQEYYELFDTHAFVPEPADGEAPLAPHSAGTATALPSAPAAEPTVAAQPDLEAWARTLRANFEGLEPSFRGNEAVLETIVALTMDTARKLRSESQLSAGQDFADKIELLRRRITKLRLTFKEHASVLRQVRRMPNLPDQGIASIFREVQGLDLTDPLREAKREMLVDIFEQNMALRRMAG